jgi:hypothetical protein
MSQSLKRVKRTLDETAVGAEIREMPVPARCATSLALLPQL